MHKIALKDFLQIKFLGDLRLSSNGRYAAFVKRDCDEKNDSYPLSVWCCDMYTGELRQLSKPNETGRILAWDDNLLLVSAVNQKKPDALCCHYINCVTGEQSNAFTVPLRAEQVIPLGDGRYAVCAETDLREPEDREENGADWYTFDELPFSANGSGYSTSLRRKTFYIWRPGSAPIAVTEPFYHVEGCTVRPELGKAIIWGQTYRGMRSAMPGLAVVDLSTGAFQELIPPGIWRVEYADMLGSSVLMCATQGKKYKVTENPNFYLINRNSNLPELYCEVDIMAKGLGIASDCRYDGGYDIMVRGSSIYFTACAMENCQLWEIAAKGVLRQVTHFKGSVDCFDIRNDVLCFIGMEKQNLQEVYSAVLSGGDFLCCSGFNTAYSVSRTVAKPEKCCFINENDDFVQGWVLRPTDYIQGKRYPAILDIHGGPKYAYGEIYYHEMQYWANHGYFVFYCNPRGSDGRGNAYGFLIGSYGTYDYDDIMAFTDVVLKRYPEIDPDRIGVTGGSYGGYMTNWIITHTHRFAAAATQRSIANWVFHEATSDGGYWFIPHMYPPTSCVNIRAWEQSPLKYVNNATTPLLIIQSDHDMRCHTGEGLSFYTGIINKGIPVRMCLFKNENHELSRKGRPQNRVKRLQEITDWMDKYLRSVDVCHE